MTSASTSQAGAEPVPKYFRIKQAILERVASGTWAPGAMIPSEVELCREFSVSRTTARKAVSDLAHEGRLVCRWRLACLDAEGFHGRGEIARTQEALVVGIDEGSKWSGGGGLGGEVFVAEGWG